MCVPHLYAQSKWFRNINQRGFISCLCSVATVVGRRSMRIPDSRGSWTLSAAPASVLPIQNQEDKSEPWHSRLRLGCRGRGPRNMQNSQYLPV